MILKIPLIKQKNCAISCIAMMMEYYHKSFNVKRFTKDLSIDEYGYSLLDIASQLMKDGQKIEFGFWDEDLIKKESFYDYPIKLNELERYSETINLHKTFEKILKDILEFMRKYPSSIKIEPVTLQKLDHFLTKKIPALIHVDFTTYFDTTHDAIHSILVIGKENSKYIVSDPLLGKKILPASKLLKAWQNGGGYYLVVL